MSDQSPNQQARLNLHVLLTCLGLLLIMGCHKQRRLQTRIKQLDERVTLLELRRSETESELRKISEVKESLEQQLLVSQQNNQTLQDEIEQLKEETDLLKEKVRKLDVELKSLIAARIEREQTQKPKAKTQRKKKRPAKSNPTQDRSKGVTRAYRAAMKLFQEGKKAAAAQTLETIGKDHPNHVLAPNAFYWLGEIAYDKRDYTGAIASFQKVLDNYAQSPKAPDALLKIGKSLERQDLIPEARKAYSSVIKRYPKSRAASLAKAWLE